MRVLLVLQWAIALLFLPLCLQCCGFVFAFHVVKPSTYLPMPNHQKRWDPFKPRFLRSEVWEERYVYSYLRMKVEKASVLRQMSNEQLEKEILNTIQKLFELQFHHNQEANPKPHLKKLARHKLAQLYTIRYERHLGLPKPVSKVHGEQLADKNATQLPADL